MIDKSLYSVISPKFKKYVPEFRKRGLEKIKDFSVLKFKEPEKYNQIIDEVCEKTDVFQFKRELEKHIKQHDNLTLITVLSIVIGPLLIGFLLTLDWSTPPSVCDCKSRFDQGLGYRYSNVSDCYEYYEEDVFKGLGEKTYRMYKKGQTNTDDYLDFFPDYFNKMCK